MTDDEQQAAEPQKRFDHGPLQTYEVIWASGHVERIQAHQVTYPLGMAMFGPQPDRREFISMHGEIDGHWRLQLRVPADDILVIRNVTTTEAELS
jgi:hypothetical protein